MPPNILPNIFNSLITHSNFIQFKQNNEALILPNRSTKPLNLPHIEIEIYSWWIKTGKKSLITAKEARECINSITLKYRHLEYKLDAEKVKRKIKSISKHEKTICNNTDIPVIHQSDKFQNNSNANDLKFKDATQEKKEQIHLLTRYLKELQKKKNLETQIEQQKNEIKLRKDNTLNATNILETMRQSYVTKNFEFEKFQKELKEQEQQDIEAERISHRLKSSITEIRSQIKMKNRQLQYVVLKRESINDKKKLYDICTRFEGILNEYAVKHKYAFCEDECCVDVYGRLKYISQIKPWYHFRNHYNSAVFHWNYPNYKKREEETNKANIFLKKFDKFIRFRNGMQHEYKYEDALGEEEKKTFQEYLLTIESKVKEMLKLHETDPLFACKCQREWYGKRQLEDVGYTSNLKKSRLL